MYISMNELTYKNLHRTKFVNSIGAEFLVESMDEPLIDGSSVATFIEVRVYASNRIGGNIFTIAPPLRVKCSFNQVKIVSIL